MTTVGVCMVRNGEDIIGPVVRHALAELDAVIVADNLSDDQTPRLLEELAEQFPRRLMVLDDLDPGHRQSEKTTRLARLAVEGFDAEWIVPFDSDEVWYSPFGRIADQLAELPSHIFVAPAVLFDHVATGYDDPTIGDPTRRLGWRRRDPGPFPKVACRAAPDLTIEEGNHGAHYGDASFGAPASLPGRLIVRHFPYRSAEQMAEKARIGAAALRAGDIPEHIGKHWRDYDALGPELIREVFAEHFYVARPDRDPELIYDPAPT